MEPTLEEFKQRAHATWAAGDFDDIAQLIWDVGEKLVATAGVEPGMRVLDVACGSGNATIPAAVAGGDTVGLDLTPELFDAARRHAAEAGVEIEWVAGDAEDLPFEDNSFDRVLSTFGVMFAPRHEVAATELARVCAPGGKIALACWTPEGMNGDMFKTMGAHMPPPPSFAQPPLLWGTEGHVRSLLEPHGIELEFSRADVVFRGGSIQELVDRMERNFGPMVMAQAALGDQWPALRADIEAMYGRWNRGTEDAVESFGEYLVSLGSKPAG